MTVEWFIVQSQSLDVAAKKTQFSGACSVVLIVRSLFVDMVRRWVMKKFIGDIGYY